MNNLKIIELKADKILSERKLTKDEQKPWIDFVPYAWVSVSLMKNGIPMTSLVSKIEYDSLYKYKDKNDLFLIRMATDEELQKHLDKMPVYELKIKAFDYPDIIEHYFSQKEYDEFKKTRKFRVFAHKEVR